MGQYGVILDAGSSGTRVYVYRWLHNVGARKGASSKELNSLPKLKTKKGWTKKIHPGLSTFANSPERVGPDHLEALLQHTRDIIPRNAIRETPVFLLATAGMRLLDSLERKLILDRTCSYIRSNSDFLLPDCDLHIQVIPGETEALYGWVATNYLLGSFDSPAEHQHGKGHHTYGFLDMGGASSQIAFSPNVTEAKKHANDLKLLRLRNIDGSPQEYQVFVTSWLEFGVHQARNRYVKSLQNDTNGFENHELADPCLPSGLRTTLDGRILPSDATPETYLFGTGNFDECLWKTYPLLDKGAPCPDEPCLLHGVHVPAIDFDVNHFIGVSEYWHTTHEIFEMGHKDKPYNFNAYQQRVGEFCSQDWSTIEKGITHYMWGKVNQETASGICFKASWVINMLHSGIGIPRAGLKSTKGSSHNRTKEFPHHAKNKGFLDPFQAVNKIDSTEVSWTLGKAVLYASSQVPPANDDFLPVGFGSNVPGVPSDFQYPSTEPVPYLDNGEGSYSEHWHDALFDGDSPRRIPGFILFILIIIIALFFLRGRNRRSRIYQRVNRIFSPAGFLRQRRRFFSGKLSFIGRHTPAYERVMEDGCYELELGNVGTDSSEYENEHPSDSESPNSTQQKRSQSRGLGGTAGCQTPSLKFGIDSGSVASPGLGIASASSNNSVMDRRGLVMRTESREHLAPVTLGPTINGRRSRTGSPTRSHLKSPTMTPFNDG